jgi:hypothetical protein
MYVVERGFFATSIFDYYDTSGVSVGPVEALHLNRIVNFTK